MDRQKKSYLVANRESTPQPSVDLDFIFKRPIFWHPFYISQSSWLEHIPFAYWLMTTLRPRKVVELGTHYGSSYFSFCQAVEKLDLATHCYAVDTWGGDEHAGQYGEEVYQQVTHYNQQHYSGFSTLIRSTFDQALNHFPEGSIDLLHIDGLHTLEAVRHDFESWLPKLSEKAVVIMHDTNVRERGFGVFKLMDELKQQYPHFEFAHGHGLGVIGVGSEQSSELMNLYGISDNASATKQVQEIFSRLGKACGDSWKNTELKRQLTEQQSNQHVETQRMMELHAQEKGRLAERITSQHHALAALEKKLEQFNGQEKELTVQQQRLSVLTPELASLQEQNRALREALAKCEQQRDDNLTSKKSLEIALEDAHQRLNQTTREFDLIAREKQSLIEQQTTAQEHSQILQQQLHEQALQLTALQQQTEEQSKELMSSKEQIAGHGQALENTATEKQKLKEEYQAQQQAWRSEQAEMAQAKTILQQQLVMSQQQAKGQQTQLETRVSELVKHNEELEANIAERFSELAAMTRHAEHLSRNLQHKEQQLQHTKKRAQKLKQTASWKLTAPIRALGRTFKDAPKNKIATMSNAEYIAASGLFDELWYQHRYPEVADSGLSAIEHYIKIGADKGYNPSELFDTCWYLKNYEDVVHSAINPLLHYILYGKAEQRHCLSDNMRK